MGSRLFRIGLGALVICVAWASLSFVAYGLASELLRRPGEMLVVPDATAFTILYGALVLVGSAVSAIVVATAVLRRVDAIAIPIVATLLLWGVWLPRALSPVLDGLLSALLSLLLLLGLGVIAGVVGARVGRAIQ